MHKLYRARCNRHRDGTKERKGGGRKERRERNNGGRMSAAQEKSMVRGRQSFRPFRGSCASPTSRLRLLCSCFTWTKSYAVKSIPAPVVSPISKACAL